MTHRWVLFLGLLCLAPGSVDATTISFRNGVDGYTGANNESFFYDGPSEDVIRIDLPADPPTPQAPGEYAWLIFSNIVGSGPNQIPMGSVITEARLEGVVNNAFDSATVARLLQSTANRPMSPARFDDPGVAGSFYTTAGQDSAAHGPGTPPLDIAWDVTAIVQEWVNGATNFGFVIIPETTNGGGLFGTDPGIPVAQRPRLLVCVGEPCPVAEPEGGLLLALGLAGSLALRSRSRTAA